MIYKKGYLSNQGSRNWRIKCRTDAKQGGMRRQAYLVSRASILFLVALRQHGLKTEDRMVISVAVSLSARSTSHCCISPVGGAHTQVLLNVQMDMLFCYWSHVVGGEGRVKSKFVWSNCAAPLSPWWVTAVALLSISLAVGTLFTRVHSWPGWANLTTKNTTRTLCPRNVETVHRHAAYLDDYRTSMRDAKLPIDDGRGRRAGVSYCKLQRRRLLRNSLGWV